MNPPGNKLDDAPFDYLETKNGVVQISYRGKTVTTLKGREAQKFLLKASNADESAAQLLMAKATGQFKFGNEKDKHR